MRQIAAVHGNIRGNRRARVAAGFVQRERGREIVQVHGRGDRKRAARVKVEIPLGYLQFCIRGRMLAHQAERRGGGGLREIAPRGVAGVKARRDITQHTPLAVQLHPHLHFVTVGGGAVCVGVGELAGRNGADGGLPDIATVGDGVIAEVGVVAARARTIGACFIKGIGKRRHAHSPYVSSFQSTSSPSVSDSVATNPPKVRLFSTVRLGTDAPSLPKAATSTFLWMTVIPSESYRL